MDGVHTHSIQKPAQRKVQFPDGWGGHSFYTVAGTAGGAVSGWGAHRLSIVPCTLQKIFESASTPSASAAAKNGLMSATTPPVPPVPSVTLAPPKPDGAAHVAAALGAVGAKLQAVMRGVSPNSKAETGIAEAHGELAALVGTLTRAANGAPADGSAAPPAQAPGDAFAVAQLQDVRDDLSIAREVSHQQALEIEEQRSQLPSSPKRTGAHSSRKPRSTRPARRTRPSTGAALRRRGRRTLQSRRPRKSKPQPGEPRSRTTRRSRSTKTC